MKTIGILGGMSWESTAEYYRIINQIVKERLGGWHSGQMVIFSAEFGEIQRLQSEGEWKKLTRIMIEAAQKVEEAGADFLLIAANTMHKMADEVEQNINIPLLHIADATAEEIRKRSFKKIGLLGTKYTMEQDFYRLRLSQRHGFKVFIPDQKQRDLIHDVLYNEVCLGVIKNSSKHSFYRIAQDLIAQGAQGIILGCTEISLLMNQDETNMPLFDTTDIHARKAVDWALN